MTSLQFFLMRPDKNLSNPIQVLNFKTNTLAQPGQRIYDAMLPDHQVAYYDYSASLELCHVLYQPTFLVEDTVKRLWHLYDDHIKFKSVQLYAQDHEVSFAPLFWCPVLEKINCLSDATEFYPDGAIKKPVFRFDCMQGRCIFQVGDVREFLVIISLPMGESMLRRGLFGFQLEPLDYGRSD